MTAAPPAVDVHSTQRTHVLNRDLLDALPTARNFSGFAALMPGVRMSNTDVGGNQQMEQIFMRVHGSRQTDTTVQVDGLPLNSLMGDGQVQAYFSDAANAEVSYQTGGLGADVSAGGLRINMIPKEGSNRISGSAFAGGIHRSWQGDNVTPELRARGLTRADTVDHVSDYNGAIGGPIRRDRLWYFGSIRRIATNDVVANNFYADGRPGIEDQWIYNALGRLTWQVSSRSEGHVVFRSVPQVQGPRNGCADRSGDGRAATRLAERAVLHHADESDGGALAPARPRGRIFQQRRVLHRHLSTRHREGTRIGRVVRADGP